MRKNIFVDLNVVMDSLFRRSDFDAASDIVRLNEAGTHQLHLSAHAVTTFAYLLEREKVPHAEQLRQLDWLIHTFSVTATDETLLLQALRSPIHDYEDAVVDAAAAKCSAEAIITSNIKDFAHSSVPALTPRAYLQQLHVG